MNVAAARCFAHLSGDAYNMSCHLSDLITSRNSCLSFARSVFLTLPAAALSLLRLAFASFEDLFISLSLTPPGGSRFPSTREYWTCVSDRIPAPEQKNQLGFCSDAFMGRDGKRRRVCLLFFQLLQVTIYLTQEQSRHSRDALAKAVYAAMFEWVVGRTNECIEAKQGEVMSEDRIFIGLLDIFGMFVLSCVLGCVLGCVCSVLWNATVSSVLLVGE